MFEREMKLIPFEVQLTSKPSRSLSVGKSNFGDVDLQWSRTLPSVLKRINQVIPEESVAEQNNF